MMFHHYYYKSPQIIFKYSPDSKAKASGKLSPDICEYIRSREVVQEALRTAIDVNATDDKWKMIIEFLKNVQ